MFDPERYSNGTEDRHHSPIQQRWANPDELGNIDITNFTEEFDEDLVIGDFLFIKGLTRKQMALRELAFRRAEYALNGGKEDSSLVVYAGVFVDTEGSDDSGFLILKNVGVDDDTYAHLFGRITSLANEVLDAIEEPLLPVIDTDQIPNPLSYSTPLTADQIRFTQDTETMRIHWWTKPGQEIVTPLIEALGYDPQHTVLEDMLVMDGLSEKQVKIRSICVEVVENETNTPPPDEFHVHFLFDPRGGARMLLVRDKNLSSEMYESYRDELVSDMNVTLSEIQEPLLPEYNPQGVVGVYPTEPT